MADTLDSLEIQITHTASGAAQEILVVASAVNVLNDALKKAVSNLKKFNEQMGRIKGNRPVRIVDRSTTNNANLTQNAETIQNVNNAAGRAGGAMRNAAGGVRHLADEAKKSQGPLATLLSSLKRIAMYRMLRTIIRAITQAFKEGLDRAYAFSAGIEGEGHRFASAMDSMKSASSSMKSSLGSAFIGLLAIIAPIVNAIISLVTALANALAQLFAVFTGGTWLKATEASGELADNMAAGGGAAKEWKNQLLGFDVINRLNDQSGGGGGGGGGGLGNNLFEDAPLTGFFAKLREKFLELKDSLNFEPLIAAWDHLKQAVKGFVDLIEGAFWWVWDNILVPFAHWTIEEVAPRLIEILAKAFEFLTAVLERLKPVFQWVWDNVLQPLAKFAGGIFIKFLDTVISLLDKLISLLKGETSFKDFLKSLSVGEGILLAVATAFIVVKGAVALFNGVLTKVFLAVGAFNTAIAAITSPVGLAILAIIALIAIGILLYQNWDKIVAWLTAAWDKLKAAGQGLVDAFKQLWQEIVTSFVSDWNKLMSFLAGVGRTMIDIVKAPWVAVGAVLKAEFNAIMTVAKTVFNGISSLIKNAASNSANSIVEAFNRVKERIQSIFQGIHDFIKKIFDKIRSLFSGSLQFPHIKLPHLWVRGQFSLTPPQVPQFGIAYYATGGFPSAGELFIAGENGAEMVGSMNGRTTVANQEQIIEGIKRGVTEAMMSVMGTTGKQGKSEVVLNINGREFYRATYSDMKAVSKEHGISLVNNAY